MKYVLLLKGSPFDLLPNSDYIFIIHCQMKQVVLLKHVKAWLISGADRRSDKTVFGLKQRRFYPRENQKRTANKIWHP